MEKRIISSTFFYVKTRDRLGGTLRTEVFQQDSGVFKAYSFYAQDEDGEVCGYGESDDENIAIKLSRNDLRELWKKERLSAV